ncbi:MAG TPA: L-2-hydroxyglutarate oxidase [Chthonomonadaceae bacterium]|nr:L-2-hydroxyglutarate oxidase [Chthonomonadaceae bacterium]
MRYDIAIVGGGIVGLATGLALQRQSPNLRLLLLEKEAEWAVHQTGHNSGVIHSGLYYAPGSLKARFAREGNRAMVAFCREQNIPYEVCGKVVVATEPEELPQLEKLYQRGLANELEVKRLEEEELKEIEPHVRGLAGLLVPSTGIVNYKQVAAAYARLLQAGGADLRLNHRVERVVADSAGVTLEAAGTTFEAKRLINCAGLQSDRVAKRAGAVLPARIVPFRGEYYTLKPEKRALVRNLIYPVPNPDFPFLGVHFTRMIDGEIHAGPNAVLSLKREGYHKTDFRLRDAVDTLTYGGFWRLAARNWREGAQEMWRSFSRAAFTRSLQRLIPEIRSEDLIPSPAGVRAQALLPDGKLADDFLIVAGQNTLHVCNAPSPAATASLEIGRYVAEQVQILGG